MGTIERVRVFPIKSLDGLDRERARVTAVGGLGGDRRWAIRDRDGEYVNGKRTDAVHRLRADFDLEGPVVTLGSAGSAGGRTFDLEADREALAEWLSAALGRPVDLVQDTGGSMTDSRVLGGGVAGATLVSTATLETVASWFPDLDVEGVRRRFRANLEVGGVPAFWEDRLVGDGAPRLAIGDVVARGGKPVSRCVVPTRDPDTGEAVPGFRERFFEQREASFPAWADPEPFDHFFALTTLVHPEAGQEGEPIAVGDRVQLLE